MEQLRKAHPHYTNYFEGTTSQWVDASACWDRAHPSNTKRYVLMGGLGSGGRYKWFGCETEQQLLATLASASYPRAIDLMEKERYQLAALPVNRRRLQWDTMGDEIDRNRLYSGEREFWRVAKKKPVLAYPLITLNVQNGINCSQHSDDLLWKGVAALNFVDAAERSGYRVQVLATTALNHAYRTSVNNNYDVNTCIVVKQHNQPVNINTLSCVLAFGGWFRFVTLSAVANQPNRIVGSFGHADAMSMGDIHANVFSISPKVRSKADADHWFQHAIERVAKMNEQARAA